MSETLIAVIVGGVLTTAAGAITEWLRGRRESGLDRAKRDDDRRLAHETFQRLRMLMQKVSLLAWISGW